MPIISEMHYSNAYAASSGVSEFLEVTLLPGEDPADYTVAFYEANGTVGLVVPLTDPDVQVTTDPVTGRSYYVISADDFSPLALTDPDGGGAGNYEAYALVDTSGPTNTVVEFYDIGGGTQNITAVNGPAAGATSVNVPVPTGPNAATYSIQFLPGAPGVPIYDAVSEGAPVICFRADTRIATPAGPRPVAELRPGDRVLIHGGGLDIVRWVGRRSLDARALRRNPRLRPVRIAPDALGPGQPATELRVSQQHRFLVSGPVAGRVFGAPAVLLPAKDMTELPGVAIDTTDGPVDYVHFALSSHACVFANGALAETLLPGPLALAALDPDARAELTAIFGPALEDLAAPAFPAVSGRRARRLIARHAANRKPLVAPI